MRGSGGEEAGAEASGGEQGAEAALIALTGVGDEDVAILVPVAHFGLGIAHAQFKGGAVLGVATGEALAEFVEAGGKDEQIEQATADQFVLAGADLGSALDVDVEEHIDAAAQVVVNVGFQGAIPAVVDAGVFEELATFDAAEEVGFGEEEVIAAIDLAGAGLAGGAGDGKDGLTRGAGGAAEGGLAGAGGTGDNDQLAEALGGAGHTKRLAGRAGLARESGVGIREGMTGRG